MQQHADLDTWVGRHPSVFSLEHGGSAYVLGTSDDVHELNSAGALIWSCLDRPMSIASLVAEVARAADQSTETVADDVAAFVLAMSELHLVAATPARER